VTKKERRISIVKDCLARLRYRSVRSRNGYVVGLRTIASVNDGQLKLHIRQFEKECQVCALGAMFLSYVGKENRITCEYVCLRGELAVVKGSLRTLWSARQLCMIESAFEKHQIGDGDDNSKAVVFGGRYCTDKSRLRAILKNMLAHDGLFKP